LFSAFAHAFVSSILRDTNGAFLSSPGDPVLPAAVAGGGASLCRAADQISADLVAPAS